MINFTVGPVQSDEEVRFIGAQQIPYFRTSEFSSIMKENENLVLQFANASQECRAVFLTGSGTAGMEAAVINTLTPNDKALVINGGSFGKRFSDLLKLHKIPYTEIKLDVGCPLTWSELMPFSNKGYTALLINKHETSTGVHYDMDMVSDFCKANGLFLIVDAVSSFIADEFKMNEWDVDVMITGSQKALACPPGIAILALSPAAIRRVTENPIKSMYFNLADALSNGERGQTPFTPAVGTLLQINARLTSIETAGGVEKETERIASLAKYFRSKIKKLPFEIVSKSLSNAVTPLHPLTASANDIFLKLKDEYGIWVCPNGGELRDSVFRVGHIGAVTTTDYDVLIAALEDLQKKGFI